MADRNKVSFKKLQGLIPTMPPESSFQKVFGGQALYAQLRDSNALLKFQDQSLREQFKMNRMDIKDQRQDALKGVRAGSAERGMLGSSEQFLQELNVKSDASRAIEMSRQQMLQGRMGNIAERMQNRRNFEIGLQQLAALEAAGKSNKAIERAFLGMFNTGGGGGGGSGQFGGGQDSQERSLGRRKRNKSDSIQTLLKTLENSTSNPTQADHALDVQDRLWKLFSQRNKLRKKLGQKPLKHQWMRKRINDALNGGAGYAGGVPGGVPVL